MPEITMGRTWNRKERNSNTASSPSVCARHSDVSLGAAVELNYAEWLRLQGRLPWVQCGLTTERRRLRHQGRGIMALVKLRQVWHFAPSLEGKPVGETALCCGAGVAGIYDVEVMEAFRGRGIGTALVQAALRQAQELGHAAAVLGATGMGLGVYARLGFREVCKLSFWKYGKMRQL